MTMASGQAFIKDVVQILALQKLTDQSEAEIDEFSAVTKCC